MLVLLQVGQYKDKAKGAASSIFVYAIWLFFFFLISSSNCQKSKKPLQIRIESNQGRRPIIQISLEALTEEQRDTLIIGNGKLRANQGKNFIRLYRVSDPEKSHYLGIYRLKNGFLVYQPVFNLAWDTHYTVEITDSTDKIHKKPYYIARPKLGKFQVQNIFPRPRKLPENMLYFHITFTNPIAPKQGIFDKIYLLDAKGNRLKEVWKKAEMYYKNGHGLSLLLHPGRVKRGMLSRKVLGPIFRRGQNYRLVISSKVKNIYGKPIGHTVHKDFTITSPDYEFVQAKTWSIQFPQKSKRGLRLTFRESLDYASIRRGVIVMNEQNEAVAGEWRVEKNPRVYVFEPKEAWITQYYSVFFTGLLTDLSGNTLTRLFEIIKNNKGEIRKGIREDINLPIQESWSMY